MHMRAVTRDKHKRGRMTAQHLQMNI